MPRLVYAYHAVTATRLTSHFEPHQALRSSIVDSAGSSGETAGLGRILSRQPVFGIFEEPVSRQKRPFKPGRL
jgi:hypothetical protein